jgi:hypothetical protein
VLVLVLMLVLVLVLVLVRRWCGTGVANYDVVLCGHQKLLLVVGPFHLVLLPEVRDGRCTTELRLLLLSDTLLFLVNQMLCLEERCHDCCRRYLSVGCLRHVHQERTEAMQRPIRKMHTMCK